MPRCLLALLALALCLSGLRAADPYRDQVLPFLNTYCVECHNDKKKSGDLDLKKFDNSAKILEDFRQWEHVVTFVKKGEMPPAKSKQPTAELRAEVLATLEKVLLTEASKLAGDPGVVPPRRLSNAEYDNTIRDLIGFDIRPAKTFPIDPSSGEGFNNTGEALTMSPSLFKKYYAAAELVGDHALLTIDGLKFAPHAAVTFADRQKFFEQAILRYYELHAIDLEKCLTALWLYGYRPAERKPVTVEAWAKESGLNPKYLRSLWDALQSDSVDEFHLKWLQGRWAALPKPKDPVKPTAGEVQGPARALANDIKKLSVLLCPVETPAIVANAGNGPIEHLARRRLTAKSRDTYDRGAPERKGGTGGIEAILKPATIPAKADRAAFEASAETFCKLFPNRFFHVDATRGLSAGFHLVEGFFRDDQPLCQWLSDAQKAELDKLWAELSFGTGIWEKLLRGFVFFERSERGFLKHADFDGFREEDPFLTTDEVLSKFREVYLKRSNVKLTGEALANHPISVFFDDIRNGLKFRTATLKKNEPQYLRDLERFAEKAYRRALNDAETQKLRGFYAEACGAKEHGTDAAVRSGITRILVSPHFCMHLAATPAGDSVAPLSDLTLASRLSYFVWAGPPDEELLALAKAGKLNDPKILKEQVRRMLKDPKVSRFALEFFGQWLGYRDFLTQEAVNRQAFPAFDDALKQAMFEEPTRAITELIQRDRPITAILDADSTFVNKKLAQHYGLPFKGSADEWESVSGLRQQGRSGVLGMAVFLTKNSQPQRTSPVKRGFWVVHKLLGEHIPPPPADVAVLPAKETDTNGKTIRELMKLHVEDMKCARCHERFDPVGLAMEGFDPIGRSRAKDGAGRKIDDAVSLPTGQVAKGIPEFGDYLAKNRKADFEKTLCQKFLGYAFGRSLQLSDQPLLNAMRETLLATDGKLSALFELVVISPQFRNQRCLDFTPANFKPPSGAER